MGLPHSEIFGSKYVGNSPKLIAAYHVLHRLSVPRHPPNALKTLDRSHYRCSPPKPRSKPGCWTKTRLERPFLLQHPSGTWQHDAGCRGLRTAPAGRSQPDECPLHNVKQRAKPSPLARTEDPANLCLTDEIIPGSTRCGGARRDRTDDLMLAKHALSQLSYGPQRVP